MTANRTKPERDSPMLQEHKSKAPASRSPSPPPPKKKAKCSPSAASALEESPAHVHRFGRKRPSVSDRATQCSTEAPLGKAPPHENRFEVGDEVEIRNGECLARCTIIDLEPYVALPERWQGEYGEFLYFHVELKQVFSAARKSGRRQTPITFEPCDLMPFNESMIQDAETKIVEDDEDLQLHNYFDKIDGRSPMILIWEKFLQPATASVPPKATKKSSASSSSSKSSASSSVSAAGQRKKRRK